MYKIKMYQFIVGTLLLLNVPIGYLLLKWEYPVYSVLISFILIEIIACVFRVLFLKKVTEFSINTFIT